MPDVRGAADAIASMLVGIHRQRKTKAKPALLVHPARVLPELEARGVIQGYGARLDARALGRGILAFSWVRQSPGPTTTDLTEAFGLLPEVEECHHIAGEADYLLKVCAADTLDLERVMKRIQAIPFVYTTETDVVYSSAFEHRPLAIPSETGVEPDA
jgi:Lrp/AsnC family leucine-responsive transcriptional regulator